ncbi:MAG: glycosyltransferase, partial [Nanoarchaeota archaeon]|nr:glycosyltransferase [Nanoarchaeota archaeon]
LNMMKVSLICTVLNEGNTIEELLRSIIKQTRRPDEFIIVDGGSKDKTQEIIRKYVKKHKWIRLIISKGANIARGRNIAIENSRFETIACIDGGCVAKKDWLEKLIKPLRGCDVSFGMSVPIAGDEGQKYFGMVLYKDPSRINPKTFLPSARNIAFKKECWKEVGGFPENVYTGEDTLFDLKLKEAGFKFCFVPEAIVYWRMRGSWRKFWKQMYNYGVGDRKAGNLWRMKRNLLLVLSFPATLLLLLSSFLFNFQLFLFLCSLLSLYFFKEGVRIAIKTGKLNALFYGTLAFFIKRIAYILGALMG